MKELKDKLIFKAKKNKNLLLFLIGISIIGLISGSIFLTIINKSDQQLVKEYIEKFIIGIDQNKLNYLEALKNTLLSNLAFILVIWILGLTVLGIPLTIFIYFTKSFILGFSISSFVLQYGIKGCLISIIYIIPSLLNLVIYTILMIFAIHFSKKLLYMTVKKKEIHLKETIGRYITFLVVAIILMIFNALLEVFIVPTLIQKILFLIR